MDISKKSRFEQSEYRHLVKWLGEMVMYAAVFLVIALVAVSISFALNLLFPETGREGIYYKILTNAKLVLFFSDVVLFFVLFTISSLCFVHDVAKEILPTHILVKISNVFPKNPTASSGIKKILERMPTENFIELIQSSTEKIDILQTWIADESPIVPHLLNAANRECNVRILLLCTKPATLAELRSKGLKEDKDYVSKKVSTSLSHLRSQWNDCGRPPNFEVKQYMAIPSVFVYRADSRFYFGPFFVNQEGISGAAFLADTTSGFIQEHVLEGHFEKLWEDESEIFVLDTNES